MLPILLSCLFLNMTEAPYKGHIIQVVDADTARGVPLAQLQSVGGVSYYTDNQGIIAIDEPGWAGQDVWFSISSHGYEYSADGFGYRGTKIALAPGKKTTIRIRRKNIAERFYRITGADLYRDSILAGLSTPLKQPLLNSQVLGCDSVLTTKYKGRIFWVWGDTNRIGYPLGNFHVTAGWSDLPASGGLDPAIGIDIEYITDSNGFAKGVCKMPGDGPTWITALFTLPDNNRQERLYAFYVKVKPPLTVYARGLAVFDDQNQEFQHLQKYPVDAAIAPEGHVFKHSVNGVEHLYFANPFPYLRVQARVNAIKDLGQYESYTYLEKQDSTSPTKINKYPDGNLRIAWCKGQPTPNQAIEDRQIRNGSIKKHQRAWQLLDRDTGNAVMPHNGSVYWNANRKRWVMVTVEQGGTSFLGEVWYSEADRPEGPWSPAVKIVTHDRYSFYNPKHQPMFDQLGGRYIYFEGTYTHTFSGNPIVTPRYDYNQIMYRLDLDDDRLQLPVAIYRESQDSVFSSLTRTHPGITSSPAVAFFALDKPYKQRKCVHIRLTNNQSIHNAYILAVDENMPGTVPLYEYRKSNSVESSFATDPDVRVPGWKRLPSAVGRVWPR